jgi:hypothetical protein
MKKPSCLVVLIFLVVSGSSLIAQDSSIPENVRASYSQDRFGDGIVNEMIIGIPLPAPKVVGDTYIDEEWKEGRILLYDREKYIDGYPIRYDLDKQEMEIRTPQGIKVVGGAQIRTFVMLDEGKSSPEVYVNAKDFKISPDVVYTGFLQVVEDGSMALLCGHTIKVKQPDYNEAMNVGNRDYRILKKENFFFMHNGVLTRVPEKKKELVEIFPEDRRKIMRDFMETNGLNASRGVDLKRLFHHYNSL